MLGELAEVSLMVAKELATRLRASEDTGETVALAGAFQKTSRVVRLTLALDFKLDREAARDARAEAQEAQEAEAEAAAERRQAETASAPPMHRVRDPIEVRKDRVGNLLNRLLWNECEGDADEFEVLSDDLTTRLEEAGRSPEFATLPVEIIARRMIADMGLSGELTLSLCEPPAEIAQAPMAPNGEGASPERRSSA